MRWTARLRPGIVVAGAAASAGLLFAAAPLARAGIGTQASGTNPSPTPSPTPIPVNAFLQLDVTDGGPNTQITVNGGAFLPNEQMTLYWDQPNKVAGGAVADGSGNFVTHVKPFSGDAPGVHRLCASAPPTPCANFTLEAAATTPSPSATPSESPSPSPSPEATATPPASPSPVAATVSGFDVITRPPFVFLPIIGALAILVSLGYWILSLVRRPRQVALPSASVVHRAMRPDYTAGFGAPPPAPSAPGPEPSAWPEGPPAAPASPPPASPPSPTWERAGESEWATGDPDSGYQFPPPPEPPPDEGDAPEPRD